MLNYLFILFLVSLPSLDLYGLTRIFEGSNVYGSCRIEIEYNQGTVVRIEGKGKASLRHSNPTTYCNTPFCQDYINFGSQLTSGESLTDPKLLSEFNLRPVTSSSGSIFIGGQRTLPDNSWQILEFSYYDGEGSIELEERVGYKTEDNQAVLVKLLMLQCNNVIATAR